MQVQSALPIAITPLVATDTRALPDGDFAAVLSSHTIEQPAVSTGSDDVVGADFAAPAVETTDDTQDTTGYEAALAQAAAAVAPTPPTPLPTAPGLATAVADAATAVAASSSAATALPAASDGLAVDPAGLIDAATLAPAVEPTPVDALPESPSLQPSAQPSTPLAGLESAPAVVTVVTEAAPVVAAAAPVAAAVEPADDLTDQLGAVLAPAPSQGAATAVTDEAPVELAPPTPTLNDVAAPPVDADVAPDDAAAADQAPVLSADAAPEDARDAASVSRTPETFSAAAAADTRPTTTAKVALTESIRAELWDIAKRAQNLQRVEAVVATTLGELSVVARHTATGVAVTLAGEAAAGLDLAALQSELAGLDVSIDLSQQSRAPEWDLDTVVPRPPQRAQQVITSTLARSTQSQLDVLA